MTKPKIFVASIATESNSFSPMHCDFSDFEDAIYFPPGTHPETPTLCSGVFPALRKRARDGEIELVEGTAAWADPGGIVNASTWTRLRDEVLEQLREAKPVQAVVLGLHGAIIAQNSIDPEGELIEAIREIVGPNVVIGVTYDPHSHLSDRRVSNVNIITVFKEFPHTDFAETGENCVDLVLRTLSGEVSPTIAVFDIKMIDVLPTSREPMRGFVDKMLELENSGAALSLSLIHGFLAGDSPNLGAKMIAITDNDPLKASDLASDLGLEVFSFRGKTKPPFIDPSAAIEQARNCKSTPVVIADVWDNPGGGVAGDSTIMTRLAIESGLDDIAIAPLWDPMAVRLCFAAGAGATFDLRFGGKTSAHAGAPIDASVTVEKLVRQAEQSFGDSVVPMGDCATIKMGNIRVVLCSGRAQAFSPDLFSNMGIDPLAQKILIIKSTNHFYGAYSKISDEIIYAAVEGPYPSDPCKTPYKHLTRDIWPRVENPHTY